MQAATQTPDDVALLFCDKRLLDGLLSCLVTISNTSTM
jgi:hypothetical protein